MRRIFCLIVLLSFIVLSCDKTEDDFSGKETLRGRLSYRDIYSGDGVAKALPKKLVRLADSPSDTLNYLRSDSTDAEGYFIFENVEANRTYDLFFEDTISGIRYKAILPVTAPNTMVNLIATNDSTEQNGIYIETKINGQPLAGAQICIFNNQNLYNADTCNGNYRSDLSDNSGRKIFYSMLPGMYYIRAYKKIGNDLYLATTTAPLGRVGIPRINFNLQKVDLINALAVQVVDQFALPVSGIKVGIYTSRAAYAADTMITASLKFGSTGSDGKINFPNINAGYYYIRAYMAIGNFTIKGSDSTTVNASGTVAATVKIQ